MSNDSLNFATDLARRAGKIMKSNFRLGMEKAWKSDRTPVTASDREINQLVIKAVKEFFPDHSILAEEGSEMSKGEYTWICDPIDGTIPFSHGLPTSVFVLSLTKRGESILGVIFDPFLDRMVIAEKGKGAYLNKRKLRVSPSRDFKGTVIDIEASHDSKYNVNPLYEQLIKKECFATTLRSTFYAGMLVAAGELAAIIGGGKNTWDGAALKVIVEEAGGKVTNLLGEEQAYDAEIKGIIASNGFLHNRLINMTKSIIVK